MRHAAAASLLWVSFVFIACSNGNTQSAASKSAGRTAALPAEVSTAAPSGTSTLPDNLEKPAGMIGTTVNVDSGKTIVGFARGVLRQTVATAAFSIMKYPVTVKQYKDCVTDGACKEATFDECPTSTLPAAAMSGDDSNAALCVGYDNAASYCKNIGGRLPTLPEWMRAARGADVSAYPWGATRASCAQHAQSYDLALLTRPDWAGKVATDGCTSAAEDALRVGAHKAGASPYQLEDILLTTGEVTEGYADSVFTACNTGHHCIVISTSPGRLDYVGTYPVKSKETASDAGTTVSAPALWNFRCVTNG